MLVDLIKEYLLIGKWQNESKKAVPPRRWNEGDKGNVLLINGWNESWYFLKPVGEYLNKLGYRILVPTELGKNLIPIYQGTKLVKEFVENNECFIVAHSKGGLLGLNLINQSSQFKKLVAIATPFGGTVWGNLLPDKNLKELRLGKSSIQNKVGKKVVCIYPKFDNHVIPVKNDTLTGAKNIQIDIVGHTRILEDKRTWKVIQEELV